MTSKPHHAAEPKFSQQSFEFLKNLLANNNKEWFNANKQVFKDELEAPFVALLEKLSKQLSGTTFPMQGSKSTMFRMNRDARFSNDKSIYKTSVSGLLTPSGTKSEEGGLIYLHLDLDGGFVACGMHQPAAAQLYQMRHRIVEKSDEFSAAISALKKAKLALDVEHSLTRMPRDFKDYEDHPHAWALKLKSFVVKDQLTKAAWTSGKVLSRSEVIATASTKLLQMLTD